MNSRLEDLMYRAGLTAQGCWDSMDDYDQKAIEKFAALIVAECAQELDQRTVFVRGIPAGTWIKNYMGIEE